MNREPEFEGDLNHWLEDGPTSAPDRVVDSVLAAFPSMPQRRGASRAAWGSPLIRDHAFALVRVAAVAVVAIGGVLLLNRLPSNEVGSLPAPSVSASSSTSPSGSPVASLAPSSIDTSAWTSFRSARHGFSVRYPEDWTVTPATESWPSADAPGPPDPMLDMFIAPNLVTFAVVSQPLPNGETGDAWLARHEEAGAARDPAVCWPAPADMERTKVGGQPAWGRSGCGSSEVGTR